MTDARPRVGAGQGAFELEEHTQGELRITMAEAIAAHGDGRMAASTAIKLISDTNPPDPAEVEERDLRIITPTYLRRGLFTEPYGSKIENALDGVIFPQSEFKLLARSPADLGRQMDVRTQSFHETDLDKVAVDALGKRAAGHTLRNQLTKIDGLHASLVDQHDGVEDFLRELRTAGATGNFAHYSRRGITMLRGMTERAIFDALHVSAGTRKWSAEQTERAIRTLRYELYGQGTQVTRVRNWIGYAEMARDYLHARERISARVRRDVWTTLQDYEPYLEAAEDARVAADDITEAS